MKSYLGWTVDFAAPKGEPAFSAPDSVSWRVFKNTVALGVGGVSAVLLEFADARIRSGVWDHSLFKQDPIGRSKRTGLAAMVGVYGPQSAARRVIQGVTHMHAKVSGQTPKGEAYRALDPELLAWVSATAGYGFLTAYDRFVAPVSEPDQQRFYRDGSQVAQLYGVENPILSNAEFEALMARLLPRFEPHPIVGEFLDVIVNGPGLPGVPRAMRRAIAQASVAILPQPVRERLELGPEWDLGPWAERSVKALGWVAERIPVPGSPPVEACKRLGLPGSFLYKSEAAQARIMTQWRAAQGLALPQAAE